MEIIRFVREGKYVAVRELRENLSKIIKDRRGYFVTLHGKPVKAVIPYPVLVEILEALEDLKDQALIHEVATGRKEYRKGGWVPVKRR